MLPMQKIQHTSPRCGTSFLLMVMLISIVTFHLCRMGALYKVLEIVLIPVIAGITPKVIKLNLIKKMHHRFIRYLILPGLWLQRLTTRAY